MISSDFSATVTQHFAYAAGRTGVLQQVFVTASDRDRLLGADSITEVEQILTELRFTDPIDQGLSKADDILRAIGHWVQREVQQMTPVEKYPIFHILLLEEDAPLISYLLKQHHNLTSTISTEPQAMMSAYDPTELKALVATGETGTLPEHLVTFVREMKERDSLTPQTIDQAVAQYVADTQLKLARSSGSKLIKQFVIHRIDISNIRTALRTGAEHDLSIFLTGGTLDRQRLSGEAPDIIAAIERSPLHYNLADAIVRSSEDRSGLEHALSEITATDIANMWNVPLSIEPVFAFAALALQQLKVLRAIVIGKRAKLSPQAIKQMIPPFLPATHYVS